MDLFIVVFTVVILNSFLLSFLKAKYSFINTRLLFSLFLYHIIFFGVYFWYALNNPSDSHYYYYIASNYGGNWGVFFKTGTDFIYFLAIPFANLGLSYVSLMFIFSWFGYVGFVYAYLFFKENIKTDVKFIGGIDFLTFLMFLPNMHFWTSSLGKGSVIFLGLMLFTFSVSHFKRRWLGLLIGGFLIYMVRPHVMLFVLVGTSLGILFAKERISISIKMIIILFSVVFLVLFSGDILAVAKLENSENIIEDFNAFTERQSEGLSKMAGSGLDMNSYPLPLKFFTFWFRPLFFDSPNALGFIISFENLLYLFIFMKVFKWDFVKFVKNGTFLVKFSFIAFLLSTYALTLVMSNLGIIMRQKSMVMYFAFFIIYYYLSEKKRFKTEMYHKMQTNK